MPDTVDSLIRAQAVLGDKPFIIDASERMSYAELDSVTATLAGALVEAGIGKGSRVGLIMPNNVGWVSLALALTRVGAVLVPLSTLLTQRELVAQLQTASVRYLIAVEEFRGHRYLDDLSGLPALRQVWRADELPLGTGTFVGDLADTVVPADPMVIMFTSGSSGAPKGVIHSQANALGAVRSGLAARCIDADTRLYLPMPFFWVGGFAGGILSALIAEIGRAHV